MAVRSDPANCKLFITVKDQVRVELNGKSLLERRMKSGTRRCSTGKRLLKTLITQFHNVPVTLDALEKAIWGKTVARNDFGDLVNQGLGPRNASKALSDLIKCLFPEDNKGGDRWRKTIALDNTALLTLQKDGLRLKLTILHGNPDVYVDHLEYFDRLAPEADDEVRKTPHERPEGRKHFKQSERSPLAQLVVIPRQSWRLESSPPGALLRADIDGPVPFHGREKETENLTAWCHENRDIGVRLYTGAGGMGKTRLCIEQCKCLRDQGWHAGFLDGHAATVRQGVWQRMVNRPCPLFLVVDYAETRRQELVSLLHHVLRAHEKGQEHPIRVVLLARAADDWWDDLKTTGYGVGDLLSGPATARYSLRPLAMTREDREQSYWKAVANFSDMLLKPRPTAIPKNIDAPYFERILLLHMSALAMIDGIEVEEENGILGYILNRERRFWEQSAEQRGLPRTIVPGIGQAMATITLGGGAISEHVAIATLEEIPFLEGQPRAMLSAIARLLHDAYPGQKWIEPIQPDLLAEHLAVHELEHGSDALGDLVLGPRDD